MTAVAIDTGGTFCDLVWVEKSGRVRVHKVPSTPHDAAKSVFDVLDAAASDAGGGPAGLSGISSFALGTTLGINTVVTRAGAEVGLLTTRGHRDMLAIMRVNGRVAGRPLIDVQNYHSTDKPPPLVARTRIAEINERIDSTGEVVVALDVGEVERALDWLVASGVETVAVSFLWSFLNSAHERRVAEIAARRHPGLPISLGSELASRMGEYERTEAAVLNAYIAPAMTRYLANVTSHLADGHVRAPFLVMNSAGGASTSRHAAERPITTLFSGPAGGIVASMRVAEAIGLDNVACADVGGTTFDVGLVVGGRPLVRSTSILDQRTMFAPSIDIVSIGAGGGSLARVDRVTGRLQVGPESAGASPGPACYGRGGVLPTVTDANLVLGYMDPDRFLGGRLKLSMEAAHRAIHEHVAQPLGVDVETAAAGIFAIVNAKMADLVRKVTVERGHDPRDFALCAYGGLGPLHAPFFAVDLDVKAVIVPLGEISSVFSAYGIASADVLHIYEASSAMAEPFFGNLIEQTLDRLGTQASRQLDADEIARDRRTVRNFAEMRYVGQLNELLVEFASADDWAATAASLRSLFESTYERKFGPGAAWRDAPVEIVGFRLEALGERDRVSLAPVAPDEGSPAPPHSSRLVHWPDRGARMVTDIYDGSRVGQSSRIAGPAILEFATTTVLVPPDWRCNVDELGNLLLRRQSTGRA